VLEGVRDARHFLADSRHVVADGVSEVTCVQSVALPLRQADLLGDASGRRPECLRIAVLPEDQARPLDDVIEHSPYFPREREVPPVVVLVDVQASSMCQSRRPYLHSVRPEGPLHFPPQHSASLEQLVPFGRQLHAASGRQSESKQSARPSQSSSIPLVHVDAGVSVEGGFPQSSAQEQADSVPLHDPSPQKAIGPQSTSHPPASSAPSQIESPQQAGGAGSSRHRHPPVLHRASPQPIGLTPPPPPQQYLSDRFPS
jgi:hypothetical protein